MGFPVTYYCPRCETLVEVERDGYLADKAVTPYPFEGWTYADPTEPFEDRETVDGVRFVCGESAGVRWRPNDDGSSGSTAADAPADDDERTGPADEVAVGCGDPFYLSFVRFVDGREVDPRPEAELVTIDPDPRASGPRGPRGPGGPDGPGGTDGR
ncbi:hypothetical protein GRS48_04205 [Halorubrum sp. JWXQ-INN 858]|uniref:hypothetical protein n=1 Tax=Halorubrum sp. JWXQ-INN 858 TaxID=2690782 RepID=UPI00135A1370|nr:hypothetical protein [Halorubrum sp. JWXQ-INN 858]MWV64028.1 hypothetical protein [Halorubrum sp. JWXQ-INN 858]